MTTKWIKWRIYCETEATWTEGIVNETAGIPTNCFTNSGHTVNTNSQQILEELSDYTVTITEESTPTGGHFKSNSIKMVCPVGASQHDFSYPHPISVLSITIVTTSDHTGDTFENIVAPNTTIGSITSDITASDTVINVSQTVMDNSKVGYYINVTDGTNNDTLGRVLSLDTVNNTLTMETAAVNGFLASTPTIVQLTVKNIDNYIIGEPSRYEIGKDKIGGSYVPANTVIRVDYTNNGGSSKDFYAIIEYLY